MKKKDLKKIRDMCIEYQEKTRKIADWLEELIDWYAIIDLPHPISILQYTYPELYDVLDYILFEVSNMDEWLVKYPDWTEIKITYDFESLIRYCEKEWILIDNKD